MFRKKLLPLTVPRTNVPVNGYAAKQAGYFRKVASAGAVGVGKKPLELFGQGFRSTLDTGLDGHSGLTHVQCQAGVGTVCRQLEDAMEEKGRASIFLLFLNAQPWTRLFPERSQVDIGLPQVVTSHLFTKF
ncbi:MAG: hypothetical protein CMO74_09270 [Verrucomicrobiales bacterium]|nr:hypothetical protein [Verrucomicrobiales bacterium]MBL68618.1 hypothetical protein [Verrucomicrobiales bacterium]